MATGIDVPTVDILGVPIHQITERELLELLERRQAASQRTWLVTVNAELVIRARESREVAQTLGRADLLLADGSGIIWAARRLGGCLLEKLPGVEIAEKLVKWAAGTGLSVYFLGAKPGVAQEAAAKMQSKYPGFNIAGYRDGYFGNMEEEEVVAEIRGLAPDILLVALGAPRQELWIAKHFNELQVGMAVGVGGVSMFGQAELSEHRLG